MKAALVLAVLAASARAEAIPAFARRYRTSCSTCHQWSFPYLNPWGVRFRQAGYQLPDGAEDPARARAMIEPGTIAERSAVFATPPISIRSRVLVEWAEVAGEEEKRVGVDVPYARAVAGGSLFQDVSAILAADVVPQPALHFATFGFHDLLGDGGLSILAGKLLLSGFQRPGHRSVTRLGSPLGGVAVGSNPFRLEGEHFGLAFTGRPRWGPVSYELFVVNGAPGPGGEPEPDAFKDALGRATFTAWGDQTLGVFGYVGRARLREDAGGIEGEWDDRFALAGADVEVNFWRLSLYGAGVFGNHDDPTGDGDSVRYVGARAEAMFAPTDAVTVLARWDAVESDDDEALRRRIVTLNAGHLVLTSLRVSVEGSLDLHEDQDTRALAFVEGAL